MYDTDEYGAIVNGHNTFRTAAWDCHERGHVSLNWTDERGTLLNVLLSFSPTRVGTPGGMVDTGPSKLWVGVAGHGCFAFSVGQRVFTAPDYVTEKLGVRGATAMKLADLITGVRVDIADVVGVA